MIGPWIMHPADQVIHTELVLIALNLTNAVIRVADNKPLAMGVKGYCGWIFYQATLIIA